METVCCPPFAFHPPHLIHGRPPKSPAAYDIWLRGILDILKTGAPGGRGGVARWRTHAGPCYRWHVFVVKKCPPVTCGDMPHYGVPCPAGIAAIVPAIPTWYVDGALGRWCVQPFVERLTGPDDPAWMELAPRLTSFNANWANIGRDAAGALWLFDW